MTPALERSQVAPDPAPVDTPGRQVRMVLGWLASGLLLLLGSLWLTGAGPQSVPEGLPDAGALTGRGLPVARLVVDVTAALTVGGLLVAAVLAPGRQDDLTGTGYRALRSAGGWAVVWSAATLAVNLLQMSDILGAPLGQVLNGATVLGYVSYLPQPQALLVVNVLTAGLAVGCWRTLRRSTALGLLAVALLATLPPALTGHAAGGGNHDLATSSLIVHVLAATLWVGGLAGLVLHVRRSPSLVVSAAATYSRLALGCFVLVAVSGAANALARLSSPGQLLTAYGSLLLAKVVLFGALGAVGWRHRRQLLPSMDRTGPAEFLRWATAEVTIMVGVVGLAVALSRTPPPGPEQAPVASAAERVLGYPVPPLTWDALLTSWRPDLLVLVGAAAAAGSYLTATRRLRRAAQPWPVWRTCSFLSGVVVVVLALTSGVATFVMARFDVHMAQHMVLTTLAPVLLVLGAPLVLLRRVLPLNPEAQVRGPRELLEAAVRSPLASWLREPALVFGLYVAGPYAVYFTPVFEVVLRRHWLQQLVSATFLGVAVLLFRIVLVPGASRRHLSFPVRLLVLAAGMPFASVFAVLVMVPDRLLAGDWYESLALPGMDLARTQFVGGIVWGAGGAVMMLALAAALPWWAGVEQRQRRAAASASRAAGRGGPQRSATGAADAGDDGAPGLGRVGVGELPQQVPS